jgi:hypothetical protein
MHWMVCLALWENCYILLGRTIIQWALLAVSTNVRVHLAIRNSAQWQFGMTTSVLMSSKLVKLESKAASRSPGQVVSSRPIWNWVRGCRAGLPKGPPKRQREKRSARRGTAVSSSSSARRPRGMHAQGFTTARTNANCCDGRIKNMIRLLAVNSRFKIFDLLQQVCLRLWISYYSNDIKIAGVTRI